MTSSFQAATATYRHGSQFAVKTCLQTPPHAMEPAPGDGLCPLLRPDRAWFRDMCPHLPREAAAVAAAVAELPAAVDPVAAVVVAAARARLALADLAIQTV